MNSSAFVPTALAVVVDLILAAMLIYWIYGAVDVIPTVFMGALAVVLFQRIYRNELQRD